MAISSPPVQQTTQANSASATSHALTVTTTAGNALVLFIILNSQTGAVSGIADSATNTWALAGATFQSGTNTRLECWYALNAAAITSVTVTYAAARVTGFNFTEWSGVATVSALDQATFQGAASSTTLTTGNITTLNANDLILAGISYSVSTTGTLATGTFTALTDITNGASQRGRAAYRVVSSTGTYNVSWTMGVTAPAGTGIFALKAAGGTPGNATTNSLSLATALQGVTAKGKASAAANPLALSMAVQGVTAKGAARAAVNTLSLSMSTPGVTARGAAAAAAGVLSLGMATSPVSATGAAAAAVSSLSLGMSVGPTAASGAALASVSALALPLAVQGAIAVAEAAPAAATLTLGAALRATVTTSAALRTSVTTTEAARVVLTTGVE
jgi:hypothetical protein